MVMVWYAAVALDGRLDGRTDGWMDAFMHVCRKKSENRDMADTALACRDMSGTVI